MGAAAPRHAALTGARPALSRRLTVAVAVVALLLAARALVAEPFQVPSTSMLPTLRAGDHVLADKLAYRFGGPAVGDIAVLRSPLDGELLLKRVVALGGDVVELRDGVLVVDGHPRHEPYVDLSRIDGVYFGPVTVPRDDVFVLGDDRADSEDSRDFGAVPRGDLVGRVDLRIWPPARAGTLR